ncbi:nucleotidyl transferase AbiEii/AbiGii toxin family protein [Serratia nevei]|uniref:nucleotidyl transferase AbiEii/AbiGii toxin family protein n=1 Tax=Serratia nevei TaxID=2703794 RepID=UPI0020A03573|nr:nucleotidyl transferase AbiEii/AbiGii toxin family protein [Serratia nevei]MCP1105437.1 nucleotidyl transferase AbiEii/AbiGii toxin family protein [Serratia nevei]
MSDFVDFNQLVDDIVGSDNLASVRPVVEKELLHYDILYALSNAGLLKSLIFQGGTSLRLCYGSNRFSEDLDFAGGRLFCSANMKEIKTCIERYVGSRYGLEVTVKEPAELRREPDYVDVTVDKWQMSVTTFPERKELPKQRIKIEIANIPAYTSEPRMLIRNYSQLPDGYSDLIVQVETLNEIMADKLVSLPATTRRIRYRDVWDLAWLKQQNADVDADLVAKKLIDYGLDRKFEALLQARIETLHAVVTSREFNAEMRRFLPVEVYERTINQPLFMQYLETALSELLTTVQRQLYGKPAAVPPFKM